MDGVGTPLNGVRVQLESKIVSPVSQTASAEGNFRFVNLPPGSYSLWTIGKKEAKTDSAVKTGIVVAGRPLTVIAVGPPASR